MKPYSTFQGARRAAQGKPILRLLRDPEDLFIVLPDMQTQIMALDQLGRADGTISFIDLSTFEILE